MMKTLIKKGKIVGSKQRLNESDILIEQGKIIKIAANLKGENADKIIEAKNKIIMPGIVDMHIHLREPGREDKETIASGTKAALAGGVTSVLAMPNTEPAIDSLEVVKFLKDKIKEKASIDVFVAGAITKQRKGKELTDIKTFAKEGIKAITDDGDSVEDNELMLHAFKKAKENDMVVICHSEDKSLSKGGDLNLGFSSTCLGLRGIPKAAEFKRVARDIELAAQADAKVHIAHVSCRESVEIIAEAKKRGTKVSAETAPHYFSLTDKDIWNFDTNKKINPPLRSQDDVLAIKQALAEGVIDVIASDHAPHTENEKDIEFQRAAFGSIGLETELAVAVSELIEGGFLDWADLVEKFRAKPAEILGVNKENIKEGSVADLIVFDPHQEWIVSKKSLSSKSRNSCFLGKKLKGKVKGVFYNGKYYLV